VFVAIRSLHFPHRTGAEEARYRGHGLTVQVLAHIVAGWNRWLDRLTPEEWEELDEHRLYEEVAEDVREQGFEATVLPYGVLVDGWMLESMGTCYLVAFSPHDIDIPALHLFAIRSDMGRYAIPYIRRALDVY